jgi:hypothetical protein
MAVEIPHGLASGAQDWRSITASAAVQYNVLAAHYGDPAGAIMASERRSLRMVIDRLGFTYLRALSAETQQVRQIPLGHYNLATQQHVFYPELVPNNDDAAVLAALATETAARTAAYDSNHPDVQRLARHQAAVFAADDLGDRLVSWSGQHPTGRGTTPETDYGLRFVPDAPLPADHDPRGDILAGTPHPCGKLVLEVKGATRHQQAQRCGRTIVTLARLDESGNYRPDEAALAPQEYRERIAPLVPELQAITSEDPAFAPMTGMKMIVKAHPPHIRTAR